MEPTSRDNAPDSRLRLIFDHDVLAFDVAAGTTLADVAYAIRGLQGDRYGKPLAIDITLARAPRAHAAINQARLQSA